MFAHFAAVLVQSVTWNDLFCSCMDIDDASNTWEQIFIFFFHLQTAYTN